MPKITINADDFGWDENRTRAILQAFERGLIHTTTAMANMPWFERAIEMAREAGLAEHVGLHLCLTEGRPLTERIKNCPRFCDSEGNFNKIFHLSLRTRLKISPEESRAVAEEATAQMEKYRAAGLPWMHLDSHHHTHTDWSIARVVMPIARKMGFKSVRRARDLGSGMGLFNRLYKTFINRYLGRTIGFEAQRFGSYRDVVGCAASLPQHLTVEMMVHPMYKAVGQLDMAGDLLDTDHPLKDVAMMEVHAILKHNG